MVFEFIILYGKCYIQHYLCFPAFHHKYLAFRFSYYKKPRNSYFPFSLSNIIIILFYTLFSPLQSFCVCVCMWIHSVAFNQELCCGLFSYYKFYLISKCITTNKLQTRYYKYKIFSDTHF